MNMIKIVSYKASKSLALEDVKISNRVNDNEEHQKNGTASQTKTVIGDLDVLCRKNRCTHFLCTCDALLFAHEKAAIGHHCLPAYRPTCLPAYLHA